MPSIVSASRLPSTTIGAKSGFSATSSTRAPSRWKRLTVTKSPSRATTIWPEARVGAPVHGEEVAVEDAGVLHAEAVHAQQVVGARREQRGIEPQVRLDVLGGEDRVAGGDAADERQAGARQLRRLGEAHAARGAGREFERALSGERAQVVFGRAGGAKAEPGGDLGAGGRHARRLEVRADPVEDLLLAGGERERHGGGGLQYRINVRLHGL